ncbi:uncharacterized protein [Eurosta solidaginis]|uniref:uncharacterized protein n=1 Tax=Eurosta solidaginis TaxID=178769 RepID=UPI003530F86C
MAKIAESQLDISQRKRQIFKGKIDLFYRLLDKCELANSTASDKFISQYFEHIQFLYKTDFAEVCNLELENDYHKMLAEYHKKYIYIPNFLANKVGGNEEKFKSDEHTLGDLEEGTFIFIPSPRLRQLFMPQEKDKDEYVSANDGAHDNAMNSYSITQRNINADKSISDIRTEADENTILITRSTPSPGNSGRICQTGGKSGISIRTETLEDGDDEAKEDDYNDAVRKIERPQLQPQHQIEEQPQNLRKSKNDHLTYEHADYELVSDLVCDVQMASKKMEVTNSNSDDSINEIQMGCSIHRIDGSSNGSISVNTVPIQLNSASPVSIGHQHHPKVQHPQQLQEKATKERQHNIPQRKIIVDTNRQVIGNLLVQRQQQQQQQLKHLKHQGIQITASKFFRKDDIKRYFRDKGGGSLEEFNCDVAAQNEAILNS